MITIDAASVSAANAGQTANTWQVLRTKSRQERILHNELTAVRVQCYLPLVREVRSYADCQVTVTTPLFPGFVFVRGNEADNIDASGRVLERIEPSEPSRLAWELRNLQGALAIDAPLVPCPVIEDGVKVQVASGPLRGIEGLVNESSDQLILQLGQLGLAASVELKGAAITEIE